jgi:CHAT domain-containing protein
VDERRPGDEDVSEPEAIKRLLRDGGYHLFHFTGHGLFDKDDPSRSKLVLGRARERDKELTAAALAEVARESDLILVFVSACEVGLTAEQAEAQPWKEAGIVDALTRAGVPATVGMRWIVGDQNGRTLAQTFYTELLSGKPAERALVIARQAVANEPDWANPILTKRHGVL